MKRVFLSFGSSDRSERERCASILEVKKNNNNNSSNELSLRQCPSPNNAHVVIWLNGMPLVKENAENSGIPVVSPSWLYECEKQNKVIDAKTWNQQEEKSKKKNADASSAAHDDSRRRTRGDDDADDKQKNDDDADEFNLLMGISSKRETEKQQAITESKKSTKTSKKKEDNKVQPASVSSSLSSPKTKAGKSKTMIIKKEEQAAKSASPIHSKHTNDVKKPALKTKRTKKQDDSESDDEDSGTDESDNEDIAKSIKKERASASPVAKSKRNTNDNDEDGDDAGDKEKPKIVIRGRKMKRDRIEDYLTDFMNEDAALFENNRNNKEFIVDAERGKTMGAPRLVTFTGRFDGGKDILVDMVKGMGARVVDEVYGRKNEKPSHIIAAPGSSPSPKLLLALALGIPVLKPQWIWDSMDKLQENAGRWLPEDRYFHDNYDGKDYLKRRQLMAAPDRTMIQAEPVRGPLFLRGRTLYLLGDSDLPSRAEIKELAETVGAHVLRTFSRNAEVDVAIWLPKSQAGLPTIDDKNNSNNNNQSDQACTATMSRSERKIFDENLREVRELQMLPRPPPIVEKGWLFESILRVAFANVKPYLVAEYHEPEQQKQQSQSQQNNINSSNNTKTHTSSTQQEKSSQINSNNQSQRKSSLPAPSQKQNQQPNESDDDEENDDEEEEDEEYSSSDDDEGETETELPLPPVGSATQQQILKFQQLHHANNNNNSQFMTNGSGNNASNTTTGSLGSAGGSSTHNTQQNKNTILQAFSKGKKKGSAAAKQANNQWCSQQIARD